jgi:hypothetical protein
MKFILSLIAAVTILSFDSSAQVSPHDTIKTKQVTVTYGRPYKKGREIFGGLVPYGKVWRLGADSATQIIFNQNAKFGGQGIAAGRYTMFAIPGENEWTIILNSQLGQWGAFRYEQIKDKDVLKVKVPVKKLTETVEQLTLKADKSALTISWDQTQVSIPMSF